MRQRRATFNIFFVDFVNGAHEWSRDELVDISICFTYVLSLCLHVSFSHPLVTGETRLKKT